MGYPMSEQQPVLPRRSRRFLKRFRKDQQGGAAVEFALVALPFFGLMMAILELGIFFFASRYFEDGIFNASRTVMTQQLPAASICPSFKTQVANNFPAWLDASKVVLSVSTGSSFASAPSSVDLSSGSCSFGSSGQVVRVTATYPYPFRGFRIATGGTLWGSNLNLTMSTVFRVE